MEYVEGASLKDLIDRGLSVGEAVEITRQVLAGARFAHSKGIIHRDLKPQNVLVDGEGRARVADFGIARAGSSEITQTGSDLGTAQYLSPEQAQGMPVTAASDLYSVGAMLYEALTGQVPFDADTPVAVALKQVSEQPRPPSELNPKVPPALDAVVLKALAKDPANRFTSADDFLRALDSAEADPAGGGGNTATYAAVGAAAAAVGAGAPGAAASGDTQPPPGPPEEEGFWTRNRIIAAGVIAALLIAGALVFFLTRGGTSQGAVPKVTGELLSRATQDLKKQGFTVITSPTPSRARVNEVIEQDPRAGTLADKGTAVTLSVSTGPGVGTVPNVVGLTSAKATKLLQNRGFKSTIQPRHSSKPSGQVIAQDPLANSHASRGSSVTLTVSSGLNLVTVPSVVGQQQAAAETAIRSAGLKPKSATLSANEPAGQVINVDPSAGSSVTKGSVVTITVSNGAGSVVVPNVVGQLQASAESTLRSNGVRRITVVHTTTTDQSQDGTVIDQAPSAGTRIRDTDSVTITVAKFKAPPPTTTTTPTTPPPTTTPTTPPGGP
jgi:serine/threonine-protein kinase